MRVHKRLLKHLGDMIWSLRNYGDRVEDVLEEEKATGNETWIVFEVVLVREDARSCSVKGQELP